MVSHLNKGRGLRGNQSVRSEPQRAWDSFFLSSSVPEDSIGDTYLRSETVSASQAEVGVEKNMSEGHMLDVMPS
jgi:hypothetical protein